MFVLRSTYESVLQEIEKLESRLADEAHVCETHLARIRKLEENKLEQSRVIDSLKEENDALKKQVANLTTGSDKNEVRLVISDDLRSVEPYIRYKESAADYLMQGGYISQANDFSVQVGLMLVANEAFEQVIESSAATPKTD